MLIIHTYLTQEITRTSLVPFLVQSGILAWEVAVRVGSRIAIACSVGRDGRPMATDGDGYGNGRAILLIEANDVDISLVKHSSRVAKRHVHTCI